MTPLDWDEHPEARTEFVDAVEHYLTVATKITAARLEARRMAAVDLITTWPEGLPPYLAVRANPVIRSAGLGKFPYRLIYQPRASGIWVLAYAHEKRRPGYWADRLKDEPPRAFESVPDGTSEPFTTGE